MIKLYMKGIRHLRIFSPTPSISYSPNSDAVNIASSRLNHYLRGQFEIEYEDGSVLSGIWSVGFNPDYPNEAHLSLEDDDGKEFENDKISDLVKQEIREWVNYVSRNSFIAVALEAGAMVGRATS